MSGLTDVQLQRCKRITERMYDLPISAYFREPVDPERDGIYDYHEKIRNPMNLKTILDKLDKNMYTSVERWWEDVQLIATNSRLYWGEENQITILAKELVDFCRKKREFIPKTDWEMWMYRVQKTQSKLADVLASRPSLMAQEKPIEAPKPKAKVSIKLRTDSRSKV